MGRRRVCTLVLAMAIAARTIHRSLLVVVTTTTTTKGTTPQKQPGSHSPVVLSTIKLAAVPRTNLGILQHVSGGESLQNERAVVARNNATTIRHDEVDNSSTCFVESTTEPLPRFPAFIIVGAQKAGTSALFRILQHHPYLKANPGLELHFFDRRGHLDPDPHKYNASAICRARQQYWHLFHNDDDAEDEEQALLLRFEKTPSYLCYPHIPALIKLLCPSTKIIVSLRNPVERLHSSYLGDDFDTDLEQQLHQLRRGGLITAPSLSSYESSSETSHSNATTISNNTHRLFAVTRRIRQVRHQKGPVASNGVFRGFYALQLAHWLPHFPLGRSLMVLRYEDWESRKAQALEEVLEFVGAPPYVFDNAALNAVYGPNNGPQRIQRQPMRNITNQYLTELYRPYNDELVPLLGEDWRGVWD